MTAHPTPPLPIGQFVTGVSANGGPPTSAGLLNIIKSYLYWQYQDDFNLQLFVNAYNDLAQQYLDWFNETSLPYYPGLSGFLLDWVARGLYGLSRPALPGGAETIKGPLATFMLADIPIAGYVVEPPGTWAPTTDDVFIRILTWHLFKADSRQFTVRWIKSRVSRFLTGYLQPVYLTDDNGNVLTDDNGVPLVESDAVWIAPQPETSRISVNFGPKVPRTITHDTLLPASCPGVMGIGTTTLAGYEAYVGGDTALGAFNGLAHNAVTLPPEFGSSGRTAVIRIINYERTLTAGTLASAPIATLAIADLESTLVSYPPLPYAPIFKSAADARAIELPYAYDWTVQVG